MANFKTLRAAGQVDGNLESGYNRLKDKNLSIKTEMHLVDESDGSAGDKIVSQFFGLQDAYMDSSNEITYILWLNTKISA